MKPVAAAMVAEGCPLSGVLYGGLMKTPAGIKVIEFNARFGDPETEVVLPLLESDIYDIFSAVADCREPSVPLSWSDDVTIGVVLASEGYPGKYAKGFPIKGLDKVDATVYHMGTASRDGELVTAGGRVMIVVCRDRDLPAAHKKVMEEVAKIDCPQLFHRSDIAHWAL
jgi:phosphoribosylamine--glycine ligase